MRDLVDPGVVDGRPCSRRDERDARGRSAASNSSRVACSSEPLGSTSLSTVDRGYAVRRPGPETHLASVGTRLSSMRRRGTEIVTDPDDPRIADFADADRCARQRRAPSRQRWARAVHRRGRHHGRPAPGQRLSGARRCCHHGSGRAAGRSSSCGPRDVPDLRRRALGAQGRDRLQRASRRAALSADRMALPTAERLLDPPMIGSWS